MDAYRRWGVQPEVFQEFKLWYKQQIHLPQRIPDEYLAQFLHSCYFDIKQAQRAIDVYFNLKTTTPEFFAKRSFDEKNLIAATKVCQIVPLPVYSAEGYSIIFGRLIDSSPANFKVEDCIKYLTMVVDVILQDRPGCPGIMFAYDITGFGFRHVLSISMSTIKKYFEYIQDGCPMRHKGVHLFNATSIMTHVLAIIKPFMYKEHAKKIVLYTASQFENLANIIPKEGIPKEYGGDGPSMDKLQDETLKKIRSYADWFSINETLTLQLQTYPTKL